MAAGGIDTCHKRFRGIFGAEIVSTIDHPYTSPHERMLSAHVALCDLNKEGGRVLPILWDCIEPVKNGNLCAAIGLDVGFLAPSPEFTFLREGTPYSLQSVHGIDFNMLQNCITNAFCEVTDVPHSYRERNVAVFLKNFGAVRNLYESALSTTRDPADFYKEILKRFYRLFELSSVSDFVASMASFTRDERFRQWVAWCVGETLGVPCGIGGILGNGDIFQRRMFRDVHGRTLNVRAKDAIHGIADGTILPSYEVFFWTLALAGIKHYGNDYGFFERLSHMPMFSRSSFLQITKRNTDFQRLFSFEKPRRFKCARCEGRIETRKGQPVKAHRCATFPSLYCHIGAEISVIYKQIVQGGITPPFKIEMMKPLFGQG